MFKKLASTFGIKVIIAILNLAIVIALSRSIGAAGKGEASIIITSIAMILLFCNMVGGSSLVYFVPRYNTFLLFFLSNLWSVIVCAIAFVALYFFQLIPAAFVIPVILLSLINSFLATNLAILLGKENIMSQNYVMLLQTLINLIVLWVLVKYFDCANINAYINSLYAAMGICLIISTLLILPFMKEISFAGHQALRNELVKLGMTNQIGHIMKFISFRVSYYVLSAYSGDAVLGVYSNGISLVESLLLISNSFSTILYPKVSNSSDKASSQRLTLIMTKVSILLCIGALIPLLLLPSDFWVWLFGAEFTGVHHVIMLLAPGILAYNVALIIGHYFSGTGKYSVNTISSLLGLITTVVLSIFFIPKFGITEAGIISSVSYIVTAVYVMVVFAKESEIKTHHLLPTFTDIKWLKSQLFSAFK